MPLAYIGIGSNLDDSVRYVRDAIDALGALGASVAQSSLYRTAPWGNVDQPEFVNAVVALDTELEPRELLARLRAIEDRFGRVRAQRWGPRTLDLDILLYGDAHVDEPDLTIPHARLYERAFVLVPLAEIDGRYGAARDALPRSELDTVNAIE